MLTLYSSTRVARKTTRPVKLAGALHAAFTMRRHDTALVCVNVFWLVSLTALKKFTRFHHLVLLPKISAGYLNTIYIKSLRSR